MFELLQKFLDILNNLLPKADQPLHVWLSKFMVIVLSTIGASYLIFYSIRDTPFGEKYGINNPKIVLPTLVESMGNYKAILRILNGFKLENSANVSSVYLVALYNERAYNFVEGKDNNDLMFWGWSEPTLNTEILVNRQKKLLFNSKWDVNNYQCSVNKLPTVTKDSLKKIYPLLSSNYYVACPIIDTKKKNVIAITLSFDNVLDDMEANILSYKQADSTRILNKRLSQYTLNYDKVRIDSY